MTNLEDEAHGGEAVWLNWGEIMRDKSAIGLWCIELRERSVVLTLCKQPNS